PLRVPHTRGGRGRGGAAQPGADPADGADVAGRAGGGDRRTGQQLREAVEMKRNQLFKGEPRAHEAHRLIGEVSNGSTNGQTPPREGFWGGWTRFWFGRAAPVGLHVLRVAAGLLSLAWLLPLMGHLDSVFGLDGWFDRQAYREAARLADGAPKPISWSLVY